MTGLAFLDEELRDLERRGLLRHSSPVQPADVLEACSNDYLGYGSEGLSHVGARGSRLVVGDSTEHTALEAACASWLGMPSALVYTSGYAANVGLVSALAGEGDLVVSMAPNHASIIDGCRLSRARTEVVPPGDDEAIRTVLAMSSRRRFVVCESYYSMDGTSPDLGALRRACDDHGAVLIVDEAHALGVFGPEGRGLCAAHGVKPDVVVGTFGKALGGQGAFVCGPEPLRSWLWNRSRSFVFSTGMSPGLCALMAERIGRVRLDAAVRQRLSDLVAGFRAVLAKLRVPVVEGSFGPIVPVLAGSAQRATEWEQALGREGVFVRAIRPPTVPEGTARLRVTVNARHDAAELRRVAEVLAACR